MNGPRQEPVPRQERIELLDVLRGFALFGILFVNLTWFTGYAALDQASRATLPTDGLVASAIHFAFDGKFYSLFALLFGVGVALQAQRSEARGRSFAPLFARRTAWLFVIGAAHATLLWFGDILSLYAVAALPLLLFLRRSQRVLLWSSAAFLIAPMLIGLVRLALPAVEAEAGGGYGPAALVPAFGSGSYAELLVANRAFLEQRWLLALTSGRFLKLFGLFLLGLWIARDGLLREPEQRRALLVRVLAGGLAVGLPAGLLETLRSGHVAPHAPTLDGWLSLALGSIAAPALCLAYASGLTLLFTRPAWRRRLLRLAPAGRVSLSSYLGQSILCCSAFYGCGLGLFGRIAVTWVPPLSVLVFGAQIAFATWWLKRFEHGPMEWAWRSLTYGRRAGSTAGEEARARRVRPRAGT